MNLNQVTVPALDAEGWTDLTDTMPMVTLGDVGTLSMDYVVIEPGSVRTPVYHEHLDEIVFLVSGELEFFLDGKMFMLRAGQAVRIPRGMKHGSRNSCGQHVVMIAADSPAFSPDDEHETGEELPEMPGEG